MALAESEMDDTLFGMCLDSETLRLKWNAAFDCEVFEILSVLLRVIELETCALTDAEWFAKTLVDIEALELHEEDTSFKTTEEGEISTLTASVSLSDEVIDEDGHIV